MLSSGPESNLISTYSHTHRITECSGLGAHISKCAYKHRSDHRECDVVQRHRWFLDQGGFGSSLGNSEVSLFCFCGVALGVTDGEQHGVTQLSDNVPHFSLLWQLTRVFWECRVRFLIPNITKKNSSAFQTWKLFSIRGLEKQNLPFSV